MKRKNINNTTNENNENPSPTRKSKRTKKLEVVPVVPEVLVEIEEPVIQFHNINSIDDLIYLIESKKIKNNTDIKYESLIQIIPPLEKLKDMIGMNNIKKEIIGQISYFILGFQDKNADMLHTVIQGPPGVGKTSLARIIGEIYANLDIIQNPKPLKGKNKKHEFIFKDVKRADLVAKYLGQTAPKTQGIIDSALGGVLFIDEAYSLGNEDKIDSFSKECIDTLNINLTEKKNQFLCIIAGYKDALQNNFFAHNEGLSRRFPFRYSIDKYTAEELSEIFVRMLTKDTDWIIDIKKEDLKNIYKDNYEKFPNSAGDVETLVFLTKIEHSKRVICLDKTHRKIIKQIDIENGIKCLHKDNDKLKKDDTSHLMMYI